MSNCGTVRTHCCWFQGDACQYVESSAKPGYCWQCSLRANLGSWDAVVASREYIENVKPRMLEAGYHADCGEWPLPGMKCNDCGEVG